MKRRASGFTLLELIVVVSVVAILAGTLLNRVWFYQEQAEKTAMVQVADALQTALLMKYGSLMAHGEESRVVELSAENPMSWLQKIPANYSGEFYDPTPLSVAPGNWVFDLKSRDLVYVVDRSAHFAPGKDGNKWVRYHVSLAYETAPGRAGKTLAGVRFEPVQPYDWLARGG